jgi:uncharacterized protein (DUF58 family)
MGYTYRQKLTKFEYSICLAAALAYLMIHQQDPVGLATFDTKLRGCLPPRSKRTQLAQLLALLANLKPTGQTDLPGAMHQLAAMLRGKSLVMLFSDLMTDPEPVLTGLHHLRHRGHDVILFHILDEAETQFPFDGLIEFTDVETPGTLTVDAAAMRDDYLAALSALQARYREDCARGGVDYVAMDTSVNFDKALLEYLLQRQRRF